jgi:tetratricopeptide (TPR) repeat protein
MINGSNGHVMRFRFLRYMFFLLPVIAFPFLSSCTPRFAASHEVSMPATVRDSSAEHAKNRFIAALLLAEKGDFWGAIDGYRSVQLHGSFAEAARDHAISASFLELGVIDSARVYAEKAAAGEPENRYYLRMLAAVAHLMKDYPRAVEIYRQLVQLEPQNSDYLTLLALEHIAAGDPEQALGIFQRLLSLDPSNNSTRSQVLLLEIKLKHYENAIETLSALIEEGEEKERLKLTLGELYVETGQNGPASKTFREIIAANSRFVPAWLALLELSVKSGDSGRFQLDLDAFYDTSGLKFDQKITLAELFYVRSARDSAYADPFRGMITAIEKRHPGEPKVRLLKGRLLLREKRSFEAVAEFRAVLKKEPSNIEAREELVSAYLLQKEYAKAAYEVEQVKKLPSVSRMRVLVLDGYTAFQSGNTRKAALTLEKAIKLGGREKERWLYLQAASTLAMCYDKLGNAERSMAMYRDILLLDPANVLALNNYAYLLALQGRELDTAKKMALQAVGNEPDNPVYLDTLGWVLYKLGEFTDALGYLEKAVLLAPGEAEIAEHLLDVYEKLGLEEKAVLQREKVKRLTGK